MDTTAFKNAQIAVVDRANANDVSAIESMVIAAYSKYIERLGKMPAPMTADYKKLVESQNVYVLRVNGAALGAVCLYRADDSIAVDDLVVAPSSQGCGYGRVLMTYGEDMAIAEGLGAITLYTNERMYENIAIYLKMGFTETHRKTEDGFDRVFFRKNLA
jgi:GNAT superfamily N-acetyltransferase